MKDEQSIKEFLVKYSENRHTEQEHELFLNYLKNAPIEVVEEVLEEYQNITTFQADLSNLEHTELFQRIESKLDFLDEINYIDSCSDCPINRWSTYRILFSIAAVFLIAATFIVFFTTSIDSKKSNQLAKSITPHKEDVFSAGNKATLHLADGSRIVLDNAGDGLLATQSGSSIRKAGDGHVVYSSTLWKGQNTSYNIIKTPKGGQYRITLSDGTKVWLNAASSLRFPAGFTGGERRVELDGEAYFEVAKQLSPASNSRHTPFYVISKDHTVEVLGTHFNIKSYSDEAVITTTLLEGSVKVSQNLTQEFKLLKPGQQSTATDKIKVKDVDPLASIAWKNGYFDFSNENIEDIMRNIARWYDVDVTYERNITRERFVGSISRYKNVRDILAMLELTGAVHFKIEGRRITVMH